MKKIVCLFGLLSILCGCSKSYPPYYGPMGSAKSIDGTTVVVSVFANDSNTVWDFSNERDLEIYSRCYDFLQMACEWIEEQVAPYGANANFIWDWINEEDLFYTYTFSRNMVSRDGSHYAPIADYLDKNVDSAAIMKKYDADNIIYMIYFNTDYENPHGSFNYNIGERKLEADQYYYEMNLCYPLGLGIETSPSSYAHEIMHCFGAVDFHSPNKAYNVTEEYIQHLKKTKSKEIMYYTAATNYKSIPNLFTDVDAYFMGLIDTCEEVEKWNLGPSQFEMNQWQTEVVDSDSGTKTTTELLSSYQAGDCFTFGEYKQKNALFNSTDPIEWIVLEKQKDKILVISRYALEAGVFTEQPDGVTWETSSLRSWLNNDFYKSAFSPEEQALILPVNNDNVSILDNKELNYYLPAETDRIIQTTEYATKMSEYTWNGQKLTGENWWWLRSVTKDGHVHVVSPQGEVMQTVCSAKNVVRPIIWIATE